MKKEQVKSLWFSQLQPPHKPGVYLTRSACAGNRLLTWWRAFDGYHWHAGIMASSPQGTTVAVSPAYTEAVDGHIFGEHLGIEWCGV